MKYGNYVLIICNGPRHGEHTNVGVMIFDENEVQIEYRVDNMRRAVTRGDLEAEYAVHFTERVLAMPERFPDLRRVRAALESMGHAMCQLQVTPPLPTALLPDLMELIWKDFIA